MKRIAKLEHPALMELIESTRVPAGVAWAAAIRAGAADPVVLVLVDEVRSPSDWRLTAHPRHDAMHWASLRAPEVAGWLSLGPGPGLMRIVYLLPGDTPIVEIPAPSIDGRPIGLEPPSRRE